jgi:hypothetical protein
MNALRLLTKEKAITLKSEKDIDYDLSIIDQLAIKDLNLCFKLN